MSAPFPSNPFQLLSFLILITLLSTSSAFAEIAKYDTHFQAGLVSRTDNIKWNIGGYLCADCDYVDVLSELEWKDVESTIFDVTLFTQEKNTDWILTVNGGYGFIGEGLNQDSDYATSGRKDEFSRSVNAADSGDLWYLSLNYGHEYKYKDTTVTPYLGYSYDQINLKMTDGIQVINIDPDTGAVGYTGPFDGLNSSYDANWNGMYIGASLRYRYGDCLASASFDYHWFNYSAYADWNLRDDFAHPVSFKHSASGEGYLLLASIDYLLSESFSAGLSYQLRSFVTDEGRDTTYFSDGTYAQIPLNEVVWESNTLGLAFKYFY